MFMPDPELSLKGHMDSCSILFMPDPELCFYACYLLRYGSYYVLLVLLLWLNILLLSFDHNHPNSSLYLESNQYRPGSHY
ncbi:hypothetical protein HanRHA438_Chr05g0226801 [Helianthus annuus]|nr:hypothetical protein HanRHA438_Chr05g0226801 [Helianthus annuus]